MVRVAARGSTLSEPLCFPLSELPAEGCMHGTFQASPDGSVLSRSDALERPLADGGIL